jgi:hypothetical protein
MLILTPLKNSQKSLLKSYRPKTFAKDIKLKKSILHHNVGDKYLQRNFSKSASNSAFFDTHFEILQKNIEVKGSFSDTY